METRRSRCASVIACLTGTLLKNSCTCTSRNCPRARTRYQCCMTRDFQGYRRLESRESRTSRMRSLLLCFPPDCLRQRTHPSMPTAARIPAATSTASSCHSPHPFVSPLKQAKRAFPAYSAEEVNDSAYPPDLHLAAIPGLRYSFSGGSYASSYRLYAVRFAGRALHL